MLNFNDDLNDLDLLLAEESFMEEAALEGANADVFKKIKEANEKYQKFTKEARTLKESC